MCREYFVGAVSQLLATHFSPLMTSHPPCNEYRSTDPRRPLSGSMKLLYHIMAVPFLGGITKFAMWQLTLRLNSSVVALGFSSSCVIKCIKADLDGTIFACEYRARLVCVMTSRQIVSCKLDPRHSYGTLWMWWVKIKREWMGQSLDVC